MLNLNQCIRETQVVIDRINSREKPLPFHINPDDYHSRYIISPYHYSDPRNKPHYQVILNWILRSLPKNTSILEVGCATGLFGVLLKTFGYEDYTGLDINRLLIQVGTSVTNLNLLCADGRKLPFKDDSIDFVGYINNFFDFDPPFFVKEGLRVAKTWAEFDGLDAELLLRLGEGTHGYRYLPKREEILRWMENHQIVVDALLPQKRHMYIVRV